jgi:hypothetical protein
MKDLCRLSNAGAKVSVHLFPLMILSISLLTACGPKPEPYAILEFDGESEIFNYSKSLKPIIYKTDSANPTALLVSEGDIIVYGLTRCLRYIESSQKVLTVKTADDIGFINGKIHSLIIPDNDEMIPWFKQLSSMDISALEYLEIESPFAESYLPYLSELAKIKPGVGIGYDGDLRELNKIADIFKPEFIISSYLAPEDFNLLSRITSLGFLALQLSDTIFNAPLPGLPKLKHLVLIDWRKNNIPGDFFINNTQLEKLTIVEADNFNLQIIDTLYNLKELIINETDTIENFDLINNHKKIELLSVEGHKAGNDPALKDLSHLRWLSFYEDATQDDFNSLIKWHPDLEVVEIINNDAISDLQPLLKLRKLSGLTITPDTITDLPIVKSLKNLKYLSIPTGVFADSTLNAELLKSLPRTRIVANEGVCLGSGWLLLLIPIILILRVLIFRKF